MSSNKYKITLKHSSLTLTDNVTEEIYGTMNLKDDGRDKGRSMGL